MTQTTHCTLGVVVSIRTSSICKGVGKLYIPVCSESVLFPQMCSQWKKRRRRHSTCLPIASFSLSPPMMQGRRRRRTGIFWNSSSSTDTKGGGGIEIYRHKNDTPSLYSPIYEVPCAVSVALSVILNSGRNEPKSVNVNHICEQKYTQLWCINVS